ncbi:hypothetical protein COHA_003453 [Chlorella ohadii]|uniref:Fungal lipase-type domain-containing protein n=1 Tax=Chlorella ohadii TaxID=2649997 RepID=A0AAD5H3W6_9CHLO|nr:hypothetical protein COHA_003453 [Chlorella ohadii]
MPAEPPDGQPDAPNGAATAQPAAAAAAAAAPPPPPLKVDGDVKPLGSAELEKKNSMYTKAEEAARRRVTLRVDVATKRQARLLTWSVILLNLMFCLAAVALLSVQGSVKTLQDLQRQYTAELVLCCICLAILLGCLLMVLSGMARVKRSGQAFTRRQRYFFNTSTLLLGIVITYTTFYTAAVADVLSEPDCGYPWVPLAVLDFLRRIAFPFAMLYMLARLHNMQLWRGKGALDADPDRMLMADQPWQARARAHVVVLCLWALLVAAAAMAMVGRLRLNNAGAFRAFEGGCSTQISTIQCGKPPLAEAGAIVSLVVVVLFLFIWWWYARKALIDHRSLPYSRYKDTQIFVRVQLRTIGPVQFALFLSTVLLEVVPTLQSDCVAAVNSQMGNLPLELSLTLAATVLTILYSPTSSAWDSPLVQAFLQEFSWTQAAVPADLARRNALLAASEAATAAGEQGMLNEVTGFMRKGFGALAQVQDRDAAAAQLAKEPIFVMETALRMFYWCRLAYRDDEQLDYKHVNIQHAMELFGLDQWEKILDPDTDTHAVLAWSVAKQQAVIAFRGTSSMENVMTDIKAWPVLHQPERKYKGRTVRCHAGFYKAWLSGGFSEKVLKRLRELDDQVEGHMRFWVTGHSLGGALAVLATSAIRRQHPDSEITTYTLGCPRVFNSAGAKEFNAGVPDCWSIINGTDPVAWIPKWGFKRVGQRVNLDAAGNLVLRPTYFELSVVQRGANPKHHMTGAYALSLATFMKNQFSASRWLPGGAQGVTALTSAMDVGTNLVLTNMSLDALKDPALLPESIEALEAKQAKEASKKAAAAAPARSKSIGCCGA